MSFKKALNNIVESDLLELINNAIPESKTIDYKKELIGAARDDKKEFLADISSFANAVGGFIVFGMDEEKGIAKELIGLTNIDPDAEILRLENIIRDGIEPRIFGISIKSIKLSNNNHSIIIYIPNSWAKPHVVNFGKHWKFYSRNSAGKNPLDIYEVKTLFLASETARDKISNFRNARIADILSGNTPVELDIEKESYIVFHIIPLEAFEIRKKYNFRELLNKPGFLKPIHSAGYNHRQNFDGILTYTPKGLQSKAYTYLQLHNNGIIEAVDTSILNIKQNDRNYGIPSVALRREINDLVKRSLELYKNYQIQPPFFVLLSFFGVKDYVIFVDPSRFMWMDQHPIDRDNLIIPEVIIEDYEVDVNAQLKYCFDLLWNAAGWQEAFE